MQRAKEIIATFLKVDPSQINENTIMDSSAIPGSVLIHRMYSTLSSEGYHIVNQSDIKTYGDFLRALNKNEALDETLSTGNNNKKDSIEEFKNLNNDSNLQVGIDIEDIMNMPVADDYREHRFYIDNFSKKEISYCILQSDPRASFAGKFALKEAIIKADNSYKNIPFKEIEILNDESGKPVFKGFSLSISHATNQAVAIAIKGAIDIKTNGLVKEQISKQDIEKMINSHKIETKIIKPNNKLNYLSIILSLIAIGVVIFQNLKG